MEMKNDWLDWVWGYERLGRWLFMKVFLALVFLVIAAAVLHVVFHTYYKIASGAVKVSYLRDIHSLVYLILGSISA